jgi:RimJ/RimL family protein N-acetyltransferase
MIETERLRLRPWRAQDVEAISRHCNSPEIMSWLGGVQDRDAIEAMRARSDALQAERGHCMWIVEGREDGGFLGICGLKIMNDEGAPVEGDVEIGWRFRRESWGRGHAREAAEAALRWGWAHLDCPRVIAITVPANLHSWGLMERIGMHRRRDLDFDHPRFQGDHPLRGHITYVKERPAG